MWKRLQKIVIAVVVLLLAPLASFAAEQQEAEAAALEFLKSVDIQTSPDNIYNARMSAAFRAAMPQKSFVQTIGVLRLQLGGPAVSRQLMGSQLMNQIPGVPKQGTYYFVRHVSMFPTAKAAQDVTVEKEGDVWRVVGFMFSPVP